MMKLNEGDLVQKQVNWSEGSVDNAPVDLI